ncbi:MAG: formylglycine-generating enzyme family protein, partial [Bacteroidales bacterium]|nr:formylglycine-generating enzyme family protein [Bacteroidales bacterium]
MKRLIYMSMGLLLCLSAAVLTGCDENNKDKDEETNPSSAPEIAMVYVEGGTFSMGLTPEQGQIQASYDEFLKPVHEVTLDGFYIGKYEVTQAQWTAVMGTSVVQQRDSTDPDRGLYGVGDQYPMYYVNWDE